MRASLTGFALARASRRWWIVPVVLTLAFIIAYRERGAGKSPVTGGTVIEGSAQGTTYRIVLGARRSEADRQRLQRAVDSLVAEVDRHLSTYVPGSELSRVNRLVDTTPMPISPMLSAVLGDAMQLSRLSGGAFDVTVGALIDAWGFGAQRSDTAVPDEQTLATVRAQVGYEKLEVDERSLRKRHPLLQINLNAIAPGYTVDRLSALLAARGEADHFVELGGEVRARGVNSSGQPFRVGVEAPDVEARRVQLVVALSNGALATSGNYRDFRTVNGVRYVHTIDPTSGRPVSHRLLSVSVLHERCAMADGWATALLVAGPERAWSLAAEHKLNVLLLIATSNGQVEERMTSGFRATVVHNIIPSPEH